MSDSRRALAVTVDDLPAERPASAGRTITDDLARIVSHLRSAEAPACGFVNGGRPGLDGVAVWVDAGLSLANHTHSHLRLSDTPVEQFVEDVVRNEDVVRRRLGVELRGGFFRYPFLDPGDTDDKASAVLDHLTRRGYTVAPVSLDTIDYRFAELYRDGSPRRVLDAYVTHVEECAIFSEQESLRLLGRQLPLILLVHASGLNADGLGRVLAMLAGRGYGFVSLAEALRDAAYVDDTPRPLDGSPGLLARIAAARGEVRVDPADEAQFRRRWLPHLTP
jgi:peptidoglycan/xylan/chitin deacetylase (PgdA/CDA1 family)